MRPKRDRELQRLVRQYAVHSSGCWKRVDLARFAGLIDQGVDEIRCEHCDRVLYRRRDS
jgi:DNA-directed RNA polymerase subunit RPC12/RpoP